MMDLTGTLEANICILLHECCYAVLEGDPQHLGLQLCIHARIGQDGHYSCLQKSGGKYLLQLQDCRVWKNTGCFQKWFTQSRGP